MKKKRKTMGKMTRKRVLWNMNPVTRVTKNKKKYTRKDKHKKGFE